MAKITYTDKSDYRVITAAPENKVVAADMNEIKDSVNALYDLMDSLYIPLNVSIEAVDFAGSTYQNNDLIDLTPMVDFNVFTNLGSGVLLQNGDGYTFVAGTGTITTEADSYIIQIWKKLT